MNNRDDELQSYGVDIQFFIIKNTTRYRSPGQKVARSGTFTSTFTFTFTFAFAFAFAFTSTRKYVIHH